MAWDDGLIPEQKAAASHIGVPARLLAGPGTGKTLCLTKRICFLVNEQEIEASSISALTFTRAAARELRDRVATEMQNGGQPNVLTLHSFALRQLLHNSALVSTLPRPIRVADDWEERHIILEDLKLMLGLAEVKGVRSLIQELSADWQALTADVDDWDRRFPNPAFLGAWQEHRTIYGYALRAELVYQLKRALEQQADFAIRGPVKHLLVDEYQDLNRCDLAVIRALADHGAELFVAGDDDQSIYGFRKAHPDGIRRFPEDYNGASGLALTVCKRCDPEILKLGLFVAEQDYKRLKKPMRPDDGRTGGDIRLLRFRDQAAEAQGVADICRWLTERHGLQPDDILVLFRTDRNGSFSSVVRRALANAGLPVAEGADPLKVFDADLGRQVLAYLRLLVNRDDHLAWRTLLQFGNHQIGPKAIGSIYDLASSVGDGFAQVVRAVGDGTIALPAPFNGRVKAAVAQIQEILDAVKRDDDADEQADSSHVLRVARQLCETLDAPADQREGLIQQLDRVRRDAGTDSIAALVREVETGSEDMEQDVEPGRINLLTMHKAKGLTAEAVIIVGAEDETIPGRAIGEALGDERRLLYVSLTRAKHSLFITFCERRTGQQRHSGRNAGTMRRSLTRFLRDGPTAVVDGARYVRQLEGR